MNIIKSRLRALLRRVLNDPQLPTARVMYGSNLVIEVVAEDGSPINAINGFVGMLVNVWRAERPRGVFVAWDTQFPNSQDWESFIGTLLTVMDNSLHHFQLALEPLR